MNFVEVPVTAGQTELHQGGFHFPLPGQYQEALAAASNKVIVGFRPEHLELGELSGIVATIQGTADVVEYLGNEELLHVSVEGTEIVAIVDSSHRVRPGDVVTLKLPIEKLHMFDGESGLSLVRNKVAVAAA
jgi:multiple sugar transport system ATP-binding protein